MSPPIATSLRRIAFFCFLICSTIHGETLKVNSIFTNHMVVQRDQPFVLSGSCAPRTEISFELGSVAVSTTSDANGAWTLNALPPSAGGPYTARLSAGSEHISLGDVWCGDVWLCAGQSNMQLSVKEDPHAEDLVRTAGDFPHLHLLSMPKHGADHPETSSGAKWTGDNAEAVKGFSAVGYQFGRDLASTSLKGTPIGLIDSTFGGTAVEGWVPKSALEQAFHPGDLMDSMFGLKPASLYNGMIAPLGPLSLRGVVWYQGENNSPRAALYPKLFAALAKSYRRQFNNPACPFLLVQLPAYNELYNGYPFTWMREAQQLTVRSIPHTDLAITYDTTDGFNLHPPDKAEVARRLSLLARRDVYGEKIIASGPTFKSVRIEGDHIEVTFDTGGSDLTSGEAPEVRGFAVAGIDGVYRYADAVIDGPRVNISCRLVSEPKTVRYAFEAAPAADLRNAAGLPAAPFRTDHQPIIVPVEFHPQPRNETVATSAYSMVINSNGMASSLGAHGRQFLSNELGTSGGCVLPGWLGPRSLNRRTDIGPNCVRFADTSGSITYECLEDAMVWRIENTEKDKTSLTINLFPGVHATQSTEAAHPVCTLTRAGQTITIAGVDGIDDNSNALTVHIDGNSTKVIRFEFGKP
jgi:sialate O-acetylesterase